MTVIVKPPPTRDYDLTVTWLANRTPAVRPGTRAALVLLILWLALACDADAGSSRPTPPPGPGPLSVSADGRYLVQEDGEPFIYLGDTAWALLANLTSDEVSEYLTQRKEQGFTVIQTAIYFDQAAMRNGSPFDKDVSMPNEAFFADRVDTAIAKAAELGLVVALHPIWGDKTVDRLITEGNAEDYGRFLGERYGEMPNVFWVMGGDISADGNEQIWRNLARGIAIGQTGTEDYSRSLMTFHPIGDHSSSTWFHDDAWLDFNSVQSGHCPSNPLPYDFVAHDWRLQPVKPVIDFEPMYENHPYCWADPPDGFATTLDVRKMAYWNYLSGGFGHSYGHHSVWPFSMDGHPFDSTGGGAPGSWREAMTAEGAREMMHVRTLMEARPIEVRVPDQSVIVGDRGTSMNHRSAARASDNSYVIVYTVGATTVDLSKLAGTDVNAHWFNPRTGESTPVSVTKGARVRLNPPDTQDWVFVADDAGAGYAPPGQPTG